MNAIVLKSVSGLFHVGCQLLSEVTLVAVLDPDNSRISSFFCYFTEVAASASSRRTHFVERSRLCVHHLSIGVHYAYLGSTP